MELKKGLLKALQINMDGWSYQQELDYEHVLFKCNTLHEYEHFAKKIPNNQ